MSNLTSAGFAALCNTTITSSSECTKETCCLEQGQIQYLPSLGGNAAYAAIFALLLITNLIIGPLKRTWSFSVWISLGLLGEIVGYVGRIMLHNNIFDFNAFLTYLIPLTIAPAFITASIYLCLARIVHILDPSNHSSRLKPMTYTKIFVTFDLISLILQGAGGGIAATANDKKGSDLGINVMIAGLAFQVISLAIFIGLCLDFSWRLYKSHGSPSKRLLINLNRSTAYTPVPGPSASEFRSTTTATAAYSTIKHSKAFKLFLVALATATLTVLIRSIYRCAELQGGFDGHLANDEVTFMILEGPMIILACLAMTVCHPGFALKGLWAMGEFVEMSRSVVAGGAKMEMGSFEGSRERLRDGSADV